MTVCAISWPPLYAVAAVIDHEAGHLVATPRLDEFAAMQAGSRNSDPASDDWAVAAHALFDWATPRWQDGKVVIKTAEAIELFKSAGTNIAPTLLLPQRALAGRPPTADQFYRILEYYLKLKPRQDA